ncbi:MAG: insulinase family protein [Rhodobacteraceae bacterium]|nr:insulinase family protein [Paracoccaceae bacterium]
MSIQHYTLPNGFQIVTEHMPGLESVALGVWVMAGGRNETQSQTGIAHFLEHMAFKGTRTRSAVNVAEAIEDVGGYINAYTSREATAYYLRLLRQDVRLGVDILADILRNSVYDPREVEVERGVILQEIGQTLDTPDDIIFDWLQETAYPQQSLGRSILGPSDNVARFDRDDLIQFVSSHYSPDRMVFAAAGGIDHEELFQLLSDAFGDLPIIPANQTDGDAQFHSGELRREKELEQAHFTLALEGPSYRDDDIYTAQIYSIALGGGMSSRLFQEVREKRGLCYTIFAQAGAYSDTGMTTIRARAQMKAGLLMGLESASNRAERLARMVQIWGKIPNLEETVARIDAVNLDKLRTYAQSVASSAKMATALYGPIAAAPDLSALEARRAA